MQLLATWAPEDGILGALAPLGLANARATCLVVDLDPGGPSYPGSSTLADIVERGPSRAELEPSRPGICVLRNGGVEAAGCLEIIQAMAASWPSVVVRLPAAGLEIPWPTVRVRPLMPGNLFGPLEERAVYQRSSWPVPVPSTSLSLPVPRSAEIAALLAGVRLSRSPWIKAWAPVWNRTWG